MHLSILIISIIVVRWFGVPRFVQQDFWLKPWLRCLAGIKVLNGSAARYWLVAVLLPLGLVAAAFYGATFVGAWLEFVLLALVLLYSVGRNNFPKQVLAFTEAVAAGDFAQCQARAKELGVCRPADTTSELYHQVLLAAGYRSLERTFVVLFWFALTGPLLPLAYRLLHLMLDANAEQERCELEDSRWRFNKQLQWVLEWPVVRFMSISFALTGNFIGCVQRWQDSLFCFKTPTDRVLGNAISGALNIDVDCQLGCEDISNELLALKSLLFRTSLFWLCLLAIYILLLL